MDDPLSTERAGRARRGDAGAEGRSNGQIAAALCISPKTASVHVSNILARLDVSPRTEAAAHAHRLGLLSTP